ncbi:MAG: TlpA disulfide reductase family protein [Actinomycetota bacterium]
MDKRLIRRLVTFQIVLLAAIAVTALAFIEVRNRGTQGISSFGIANHTAIGDAQDSPAPSFSIESLDGGTVSLEAFRGHLVVLNFWATWCTPCRQEAPAFSRLSRVYEDQGVRFMGMNERDDRYAAQAFVREFKLPYPSGFDPAGSLVDDFALYAMPTTFLIDPAGTIRYRFVGYLDESTLRSAIDDLLAKEAKP